MPDDLMQQLEQAQADYQKLYSQYQEELAFIARWQQRMKAENKTLRDQIHTYNNRLAGYISERFPNMPIGVLDDREGGVLEGLTIAQGILRTILNEGN